MTGGEAFGSWAAPSDPPRTFGGAFVTKTIPHSPHGRPQSISVTLLCSRKLPLFPPPTHKGRESWKVEVMMPTFLPSSWFRCRHDPTGQEKPNHPREFFRECLPFSWRLSSQHLHDATHAWRDCFTCVKIKASLLKQQFLKSFITRKAQCR